MRSSVDAHFAVSSETPSVPAKRVEMNPMRRHLVGTANMPRAPSGPVIVTSPPLLEGTVPRYGRPVNRATTGHSGPDHVQRLGSRIVAPTLVASRSRMAHQSVWLVTSDAPIVTRRAG